MLRESSKRAGAFPQNPRASRRHGPCSRGHRGIPQLSFLHVVCLALRQRAHGVRWFVLLVVTNAIASGAHAEASPTAFRASEQLSLTDLERAVQAGAPALAQARRELEVAQAEAQQARVFSNPSLDAAWSTIPVGVTNPADLQRPFANVPNYAVGLSYTFPVAKRAPRRRRADALVQAADFALANDRRELALELAKVLGELATATVRRDAMRELVEGGQRAIELAEARLAAKFGTPLDVDQIRIEVERTAQLLTGVESDIELALANCAGLVGVPCESFRDADSARAYLKYWLALRTRARKDLGERADLRALRAYGSAAHAEAELAAAERLPDPTLRVGYVHDRFLISGNQLNSLNVGVSVPLPVFDHGQYRRRAAESSRDLLGEEHARRLDVARRRIPPLEQRLALSEARCTRLEREIIPKALEVLQSLEQAVANRLLPLPQAIQSRRIASELVLEEADSCGDAYLAALELIRESPPEGDAP